MASTVVNLLSGGLLSGVSQVINSIRGKSPEDAAKLQELTLTYQSEFQLAQVELEKQRIAAAAQQDETAGANIRAEITSPDAVVRRGRVIPMYIGGLVLLVNYCVLPFVRVWHNFDPIVLPSFFWYLYMFAIGGYVGHGMIDRALGGSGGDISFLGVKLGSKGD